jgi:hypothetical protein
MVVYIQQETREFMAEFVRRREAEVVFEEASSSCRRRDDIVETFHLVNKSIMYVNYACF